MSKDEKHQYDLAMRYFTQLHGMGVSYAIMEGALSDAMDAHIRQCEIRAELAPMLAAHKENIIANKFCNLPGNEAYAKTGLYNPPILPADSIGAAEHPDWPVMHRLGAKVKIARTGKEVVITKLHFSVGLSEPSYNVEGSRIPYYHYELESIK